jgi:hypothetical protein
MNRINGIRNLALSIVLAGLSLVGGAGCLGQATSEDISVDEAASRKARYAAAQGSDDGSEAHGEPLLDIRRTLMHPNAGNSLGARPELWGYDGEANGPRPEPWAQHGDVDSSGSSGCTPPPSGSGTSSGSSTSSSGGNPGNPNPSSN